MEQQRIFRQRFIDNLMNKIRVEDGVTLFRNSEFQFDNKDTLIMPHIEKPMGLITKVNANDDFNSAISLFEHYSKLTPLEAGDSRFWNYLSLIDLYPYLLKRWPNIYERKENINGEAYIFDHFILEKSSHLLRHWLSGLWWSVYLSFDPKNDIDKYKFTQVLFWNQTLRTRTLGTYMLARNKEIALGFLDYCLSRGKDNFTNFEKEHQELTEYLNKIGGTKPLTLFTREEIKELLFNRFSINQM